MSLTPLPPLTVSFSWNFLDVLFILVLWFYGFYTRKFIFIQLKEFPAFFWWQLALQRHLWTLPIYLSTRRLLPYALQPLHLLAQSHYIFLFPSSLPCPPAKENFICVLQSQPSFKTPKFSRVPQKFSCCQQFCLQLLPKWGDADFWPLRKAVLGVFWTTSISQQNVQLSPIACFGVSKKATHRRPGDEPFLVLGSNVHDWGGMAKNGPFWTKNGQTWQACQRSKVIQKGSKRTKTVNLRVFDHFAPLWTHWDHFWLFQRKIDFLLRTLFIWGKKFIFVWNGPKGSRRPKRARNGQKSLR